MYLRFGFLSNGNFISIKSVTADWLSVEIINDVIKLKVKLDDYFDEVSIKFETIDSSWVHLEVGQKRNSWFIDVNGEKRTLVMPADVPNDLCNNHIHIGNLEVNTS